MHTALNTDSVTVLFRLVVNIRPQLGALRVGSGILRYLHLIKILSAPLTWFTPLFRCAQEMVTEVQTWPIVTGNAAAKGDSLRKG